MTQAERNIIMQETVVAQALLDRVDHGKLSDASFRALEAARGHLKRVLELVTVPADRTDAALTLVHDTKKIRSELLAYKEYHKRRLK